MDRRIWLVAGVIALAGVLMALPVACDREDRELDDDVRRQRSAESGEFAALTSGTTHYQVSGAGDPTMVLIHGTSGPMTVWDDSFEAPGTGDRRILRYDLFGRGYSDRVDVPYDLDLFVVQLEELLSQLKITGPLVLVGSSLGGIIAAEFAQRHTDRTAGVVLLGPAGFPLEASGLAKAAYWPGIGEWMMAVFGDRMLVEHHRGYFVEPDRFESHHEGFSQQLRFRRSKSAILSTLRETPLQGYLDGYSSFGALEIPTLVIWGREDRVFPFDNSEKLLERVPHARMVALDRAGHLPQLERAEETKAALRAFP